MIKQSDIYRRIGLMQMPDVCTMGNFLACCSLQAVLKLGEISFYFLFCKTTNKSTITIVI